MAIPNTRKMTRRPTHPGEMLREDFRSHQTAPCCLTHADTTSDSMMLASLALNDSLAVTLRRQAPRTGLSNAHST